MTSGRGAVRVAACLSLTGRFARFGTQAALGLEVWHSRLRDAVDLKVVDDRGDPDRLRSELVRLAGSADLLLGPYSTNLMRAAADIARDQDLLVWNHGGSGDDVEAAAPGHVVSILAPTSRYAVPFVQRVARLDPGAPLGLRSGRGSFGRQVIDGAEVAARGLGLRTMRARTDEPLGPGEGPWNLFCAGSFEEDVDTINGLGELDNPPRLIGSVAAGVQGFARAAEHCEGIYGIAQWAPGQAPSQEIGPSEVEFLNDYRRRAGILPDYPAVQAAAAAALALHCAHVAGGVQRDSLWAAATALRTTTMFGPFAIDPVNGAQIAHVPVYGVHTAAWGHVGEIELLSALRARVEEHARRRSADWPHGTLVVTSRSLDESDGIWVLSEWRAGVRCAGGTDEQGRWRKVRPVH